MSGGAVVFHPCRPDGRARTHERATQTAVARSLAQLLGLRYAGLFDPGCRHDGPLYFVPDDTLTLEAAHRLGIRGEQDLFGGVVPFAFVATKTITHPLPSAQAVAPRGWSTTVAERLRDVVLPGFSAFSRRDARAAATRLLAGGAVRLKEAGGVGGLGQTVVADAAALEAALASLDDAALEREGLVVERNLADVTTYSVGRVRVGELEASYVGTQQLALNHHGDSVYGGSDLTVARGGFDALLALGGGREVQTAIAQGRSYHAAALASFPGVFASRCNYDIVQGVDGEGRWCSGVLEQSWRIGGASGAELAALQAFRDDPALAVVRASTAEVYGEHPPLPADAVVQFSGIDEHVGAITKYVRLRTHGDA